VSSQLKAVQKKDTMQTQQIQALWGQFANTRAAATASREEAFKRQSIMVRVTKELSQKYDDRLRAKDQAMRAMQMQLASEEEHDRSINERAESDKKQLTVLRAFSERKEQELLALHEDALAKEREIDELQARLAAAKMQEQQQKKAAVDAVDQKENSLLRKELTREVEVLQKARKALEFKDRQLKRAHSEFEADNKEIKALRREKAHVPEHAMQWNATAANTAREEGSRDDTQISLAEGSLGTSGTRSEGDEVSNNAESGGEMMSDSTEASTDVAAESEEQSSGGDSSDDDAARANEEQSGYNEQSAGGGSEEQAEDQNEEGGQSYSDNARAEEVQGDAERGGETEGSADSEDSSSDSEADRAVLEELSSQA